MAKALMKKSSLDLSPVSFFSTNYLVVFNRPDEQKFVVYISDILTNQTISEIENTVIGSDDKLEDRFDAGQDHIRTITVDNVQVVSVKKSLERKNSVFANALIVVVLNETETQSSG